MSPKVIAILVVILLVIIGGMALTMKKATRKNTDRLSMDEASTRLLPDNNLVFSPSYSMRRCFIA